MASFLSRMANEASAALSDAYGHLMHGDDAGASAKVVWVVHPTNVPIDIHSGIADSNNAAGAGAGEQLVGVGGGGMGNNGNGASSTQKMQQQQQQQSTKNSEIVGVGGASNASVASPGRNSSPYLFTQKFDLGMTFLEINDRAYVRSVDAGSKAEKAGIQPRDCVQFALVVGGPQFEDLQSSRRRNTVGVGIAAPTSPHHHHHHHGRGRNNNRDYYERENNEEEVLDAKATKFALECEKRGMRTSYNELRDLFAGCTLRPKGESAGGGGGGAGSGAKDKMMESTLHLPAKTPSSRPNSTTPDDDFTIGSNSLILTDSVGGIFEHTKKSKEYVSSRRVPLPDNKTAKNVTMNVTNAAMHVAGRCFDGDDGEASEFEEDHHQGATGPKKSSPPLDTPMTPIKSNNLISSSSPRQSGATYGDGMLEQSLWPVVLVFRRTVQRKRMLSNNKWGSPGLSLRGSLFGIPSLRMDDECDRAAALIRQLAPRAKSQTGHADSNVFCTHDIDGDSINAPTVATATEHAGIDENIEASTIRGMIEAAVGLGFVRVSKVVVGVSLQHGSGIIISRLPDGTWSAPSALGVYGLGVGFQFGLEVADFMFIIQTNEGMDHFKNSGNFVVGGNIGAAVVNCGREAYGAASLGVGVCSGMLPLEEQNEQEDAENDHGDDDEKTYQSNKSNSHGIRRKKKGNDIAPMVAYAKSQGLYFGVSVDGLRFFTRNDINARTYKFSMLNDTSAKCILSGLVVPPPEAEDLYSALHSVEYIHEIIELPRPPEMLRKDSMNDWRFDRSIACVKGEIVDSSNRKSGNYPMYSFLSTLNREESDRFAQFETKFKKFLYGGVTVQHLKPNSAPTRDGMTRREKRTLWLMLPEVGSLRLGLVSSVKDNGIDTTMDDVTVASSAASSRADADDPVPLPSAANVRLSLKYSVSLTDITSLSQDPNATIRLSPDDATEHLRVISICDATGKSILFLANSNREAELLFCGLKLLLECETSRLSVRGGVPLNKLGGKLGKGALSPISARGTTTPHGWNRRDGKDVNNRHSSRRTRNDLNDSSKYSSLGEPGSSSDESPSNDGRGSHEPEIASINDRHKIPEGRQSWSQLPGRSKMKEIASGGTAAREQLQYPTYELGKPICTDIATNISLPLPLSLCRVLILDSSSPVNRAWENGRADTDFRHDAWTFPPGSIREFEVNSCSEQQLISRGPMTGAQRTITHNRVRNGEMVRLSETLIVEQDDLTKGLLFAIKDEMPRRGFQAKVCIHLRSFGQQSCEARVVTDIRPVGKNISNQQAVHNAYILVLDEMKKRYGLEDKGWLAVVLDVCNTLPRYGSSTLPSNNLASQRSPQASLHSPNSKILPSMTSFKDDLPANKGVETPNVSRLLPGDRSPSSRVSAGPIMIPQSPSPARQLQQSNKQERPSTPSIRTIGVSPQPPPQPELHADEFANFPNFDDIPKNPVTVEVKPLPKIRLDLLPVPREEDEEEDNSLSAADKLKRKSKHSKHKHRRSSRNK